MGYAKPKVIKSHRTWVVLNALTLTLVYLGILIGYALAYPFFAFSNSGIMWFTVSAVSVYMITKSIKNLVVKTIFAFTMILFVGDFFYSIYQMRTNTACSVGELTTLSIPSTPCTSIYSKLKYEYDRVSNN